MKVLYTHLLDNMVEKPSINDLSESLFQLGHEHEIENGIFDLELTPNRGDCLSLNGLLRDLNLFYESNNIKEIYEKDINKLDLKFTNNAQEACPKISFLKIEIESVPQYYNDELDSYFSGLDIKKNNFFTDISNFLSYESGQPTHCYEANKVEKGLTLDFSKDKQEFQTLLDKTIDIEPENLVFFNDKKEIINLAGIIGGANTCCNAETKSVIIECAYFNPEIILGKAVKFSINSEAAHKFERNVDPNSHDYVLRRFIKIVQDHAEIINLEFSFYDYSKTHNKVVDFNVDKINKILGTDLAKEDCKNYLQSFGFVIKESLIHIPSYRQDINTINDISEEIARAVGYNKIIPKELKIKTSKIKHTQNTNEIKLKNLLVSNGFCEVINDPFTIDHSNDSIKVDNPLDANRRFLRTSLKNSLLQNLFYNERRQQDSIKLFEISDIYSLSPKNNKTLLGIIVSGRVNKNYIDFTKKLNKEYLVNFLSKYIDNKIDAKVEVISRDKIKSKSKNPIAFIEIALDESLQINYHDSEKKIQELNTKYIPVSEYPSSTRDLSFLISDFSMSNLLQEKLLNTKTDLLKEVFMFDYFINEDKEEIKIGFRFVFQSSKATITDEEVNSTMSKIIEDTKLINGVTIPGVL
jgi:phenylalanyl-tRNA synthetase beta chain